jgi:hypothetical protein
MNTGDRHKDLGQTRDYRAAEGIAIHVLQGPGSRGECPHCHHKTLSTKRDGSISKCFHPSCGWFVTRDGERKAESHFIHGILQQLFTECHAALLVLERVGKSNAWTYLVIERGIHPDVIYSSLVGSVPPDYPVHQLFANAYKALRESDDRGIKQTLKSIDDARESLERCLAGAGGWLCFFYTDAHHRLIAVRFRKPFTKEIRYFKPLPSAGLFGMELFAEQDRHFGLKASSNLIVCEGEFNQLQLQSLVRRYEEESKQELGYVDVCAVGGVENADVLCLSRVCDYPIICYDNDESGAGYKLVERATKYTPVLAFTTPGPNSDLDEHIRSFGADSPAAYGAVKELIGTARKHGQSFEEIYEEVKEIRLWTKVKEFEIHQAVAGKVYTDLCERGKFFHSLQGVHYFDDETKKLIEITPTGTECKLLLHRYGINASETLYKYLVSHLMACACEQGTWTEIHRLSFYNATKNVLYLFDQANRVFRISPDAIDTVDNGIDGVLFLPADGAQPFAVRSRPDESLLDRFVFGPVNFSDDVLTADERRLVLCLWLLSLFFPQIMPTKPILAFVGEKGSGKSLTLRKIGVMLFGPAFNVMPLPEKEDGFDAAVSNSAFVAIDNADTKSAWLEDRLALAATGGKIRKRALYTDNQMVEIPITSSVAITSRTPYFRRDDVADRLLIMRVDRLSQFRPENEMLQEILANRDALMTELAYYLQDTLKALAAPRTAIQLNFRMADFASFCVRVGRYGGLEEAVRAVLQKLSSEQSIFTLESEGFYGLLREWVGEHPNEPVTSGELYLQLLAKAEKNHTDLGCRNERSFAQKLSRLKPNLEHFLVVEQVEGRARGRTWKFSLKGEEGGKW